MMSKEWQLCDPRDVIYKYHNWSKFLAWNAANGHPVYYRWGYVGTGYVGINFRIDFQDRLYEFDESVVYQIDNATQAPWLDKEDGAV